MTEPAVPPDALHSGNRAIVTAHAIYLTDDQLALLRAASDTGYGQPWAAPALLGKSVRLMPQAAPERPTRWWRRALAWLTRKAAR